MTHDRFRIVSDQVLKNIDVFPGKYDEFQLRSVNKLLGNVGAITKFDFSPQSQKFIGHASLTLAGHYTSPTANLTASHAPGDYLLALTTEIEIAQDVSGYQARVANIPIRHFTITGTALQSVER